MCIIIKKHIVFMFLALEYGAFLLHPSQGYASYIEVDGLENIQICGKTENIRSLLFSSRIII